MVKALYSPDMSLRTSLQDAVIASLPKTDLELTFFHRAIERSVHDFESKLNSFGLLPRNAAGDETVKFLSLQLESLPDIFVTERRKEILSRAREIILADYHNSMLAAGDATEDDPASAGDIGDLKAMIEQSGSFAMQALRFDPCQVSLAACRVLQLVHEVMKQGCASSAELARVLYHCARDSLELFIAIVPVKFQHIIATVPRMGAVFFNDCAYIAHNCVLITHQYREDLGKANAALMDACGFIDFIARFRSIGEQVLAAHLDEQKKTFETLIDRINLHPVGETETSRHDRSVLNDEEGASLIVKHFQKLSGQWRDVLQEPVLDRLQGHLVDSVLRRLMTPLLQALHYPALFAPELHLSRRSAYPSRRGRTSTAYSKL